MIEASWLFGVAPESIEVVVHRESIVHSLIEYRDHSVIAQLGLPDMRIPIQYALTFPQRLHSQVEDLRLWEYGTPYIFEPDRETFRCLPLCIQAMERGGLVPAAVNGANEKAVELFLAGKIGFLDIPDLVQAAMEHQPDTDRMDLEAVLQADREARCFVEETAG